MPKKSRKTKTGKGGVSQKQGVNIHIDMSRKSKGPKRVVVESKPTYSLPQQTVHQPDHGILYNILQNVKRESSSNLQTLTEPRKRLGEVTNELTEASELSEPSEPQTIIPFAEPVIEGQAVGKRGEDSSRLPVLNSKRYAQLVAAQLLPYDITNDYHSLTAYEKLRLKKIFRDNEQTIGNIKIARVETAYGEKD